MQNIYTVEQVAGHLGRSPRTVRAWITAGRLAARKVGRSYLITEDALSSMVEPKAPAGKDRAAIAREFIDFMQSLDLPRGSMERTMRQDVEAETRATKRGRKK
jgi:excisionase family DNA binding protein